MSYDDEHRKDHDRILERLDVSKMVYAMEKDILLLQEKCNEQKLDKEKASKNLVWICGMAFSIIMTVAGSAIQQNATVQVLQEKVTEQKREIEKLNTYISDVDANLRYEIDQLQ